MLTAILVNIFGALVFLFIFWRELREDYISEQIFTVGFYAIFGSLTGALLALRFFPDYWFWMSLVFASLGLAVGMRRFDLRFYETLQAMVVAALPWLGLVFLHHAVSAKSVTSFVGAVTIGVLIATFWFLDKHYKKFTWYRSGRIGFAGITTLGIFFLARTAVAPFADSVLSFAGKYDVLASGVVALGTFLLLWKLSKTV